MSTVVIVLLSAIAGTVSWELAGWLLEGRRCIAVREKHPNELWGRCNLRRGHQLDHELHRYRHRSGAHLLSWSTAATGLAGEPATFMVMFDDPAATDEMPDPERRPRHRRRK